MAEPSWVVGECAPVASGVRAQLAERNAPAGCAPEAAAGHVQEERRCEVGEQRPNVGI